MSSSEDRFCSKCGASLNPGAAFCPSCGNPMGSSPAQQQKMSWKEYRYARRKGDRSGPLIGGLIVIWLGITLYLGQTPYIVQSSWWGYFLVGAGVILIVSGLMRWTRYSYRYPPTGYLIGGIFLLIIGLSALVRASFYGPGILIAIGAVIIAFGVYSMKERQAPKSTTPQTQA